MVGTAQANRTGADAAEACKAMKRGSHNTIIWQHKTLLLVFAGWADNNVFKTLRNCHTPVVIAHGVNRRIKTDGVRQHSQTPVDCPAQQETYSNTFHFIDKGNGAETMYDIQGKCCTHEWVPKLGFWLYNMNMNNAFKIYGVFLLSRESKMETTQHAIINPRTDTLVSSKRRTNEEAFCTSSTSSPGLDKHT